MIDDLIDPYLSLATPDNIIDVQLEANEALLSQFCDNLIIPQVILKCTTPGVVYVKMMAIDPYGRLVDYPTPQDKVDRGSH